MVVIMELENDNRKKLDTAIENAAKLRTILEHSNENTNKITGILTNFDNRLLKLEETVRPVYKETGQLQRKQEDIISALGRLDHAIRYYTIVGEVESNIISGFNLISYELYLNDMNRLIEAHRYLSTHNPQSPEHFNISSLIEKGVVNIEKEFRQLLTRHSLPLSASSLLELIDSSSENGSSRSPSNSSSPSLKGSKSTGKGTDDGQKTLNSTIQDEFCETIRETVIESPAPASIKAHKIPKEMILPEKSRKQLSCMAEWLSTNQKENFIDVYAAVRSDILRKSLSNLSFHLKSSSMGAVITSNMNIRNQIAPLLGSHGKLDKLDLNVQIKRPPRIGPNLNVDSAANTGGGGFRRKFHDVSMLNFRSSDFYAKDSSTTTLDAVQLAELNLSERDIISYIISVTGLYKLMQLELHLLEGVIPQFYQKLIFSRLVMTALDSIYHEGEQLSQRVKKLVSNRDFTSALYLLPVYRYHTHMRHNFDLLLDGCEPEVQNKLHSLGVTLQTTISKALEEFIDYIKTDVDTRLPQDGTVHQLTSNVMLFLVHLHSYLDILSRVLMITAPFDVKAVEMYDKNHLAFALYIYRVLAQLGLTLMKKSDGYANEQHLQALFRLNNQHYTLKTLRLNGLLDIVKAYNPDTELYYRQKIGEYKQTYGECWNRLLSYVLETSGSGSISQQRTILSPQYHTNMHNSMSNYSLSSNVGNAFKLKDRERQMIKDKFAGFNKEFELLYNTQKNWAVPDLELREELVRENCRLIVPPYALFYDKYVQMDFTKNVHKYIKYTPDHVAQLISKFFDSAS